MTAAIATALRETADRAIVAADAFALLAESDRLLLVRAALRLAEAVANGEKDEELVAAYLDRRALWMERRDELARVRRNRADAERVADAADRELAHANPFQADAEAWTNERALQEAQTEKEARHA